MSDIEQLKDAIANIGANGRKYRSITRIVDKMEAEAWGDCKSTGIKSYDAIMYIKKLQKAFPEFEYILLANAHRKYEPYIVAIKVNDNCEVTLREFYQPSDDIDEVINKLDITKDNFSKQVINKYAPKYGEYNYGRVKIDGSLGFERILIQNIEYNAKKLERYFWLVG